MSVSLEKKNGSYPTENASPSFWSSASKLPVPSEVVNYPSMNGQTYNSNGNNIIEFQIPSSVGFIQPSATYLKFEIDYDLTLTHAITGAGTSLGSLNQRLQLIPELGGSACFRSMTIRDGYGHELENIQNCNALSAIKLMYDDDLNKRNKRSSTEGVIDWDFRSRSMGTGSNVEKLRSYNTTTNPCFPASINYEKKPIVVCIPIHCSGLLSEINDRVLPVGMLNGITISLQMEDPRYVWRSLKNAISTKTATDTGYAVKLSTAIASAADITEIVVKGKSSPPYDKFLNTSPFCIGEMIGITSVADLTNAPTILGKITAIAVGTGGDENNFKITFSGTSTTASFVAAEAFLADSLIFSIAITDATENHKVTKSLKYSVSNVSIVIKKCILDPQYIKAMTNALTLNGSINYPYDSYQNYQRTVNLNELHPTMDLPLINSRGKSILHQPCEENSDLSLCLTNFLSFDSGYFKLCGFTKKALDYSVIIKGRMNPDRAVDLEKTSKTNGFSQRAIVQLHQGLVQANFTPTNLNSLKSNFLIGKPFSLGNGIMDLRDQDYQLKLTYDEVTTNKNFNNFVSHQRVIEISNNNISLSI